MCNIQSYVFFDIETTGLPWQEKNQTKITELSFVVALREDFMVIAHGSIPPVSKLTLVFNPERPINPEVVKMNGLSNKLLSHAPVFRQKIDTMVSFLQGLPKPVCLVAHNGNVFDFKILLAEFCDANMFLPNDLLCVDTLICFRHILAKKDSIQVNIVKPAPTVTTEAQDLLTDDEDEWPDLNLSTEEWKDIDEICDSLSDMSCEDVSEVKKDNIKKRNGKKQSRSDIINRVFTKTKEVDRTSFTLFSLYKRLVNKEPHNHHRAEDDCCMLLECVLTVKNEFIEWADTSCKKLVEIKPLVRH